MPVAAVLLLAIGGGAWLLWGPRGAVTAAPAAVAAPASTGDDLSTTARDATPNLDPSVAVSDSATARRTAPRVDTASLSDVSSAREQRAVLVPPVATPAASTSPAAIPSRAASGVRELRAESVTSEPAPVAIRWQRARATTWVNVRSGATRDAEIVGRVQPEVIVQLGEWRAGWRAIRAGSIAGWVDPTLFVSDSALRTP